MSRQIVKANAYVEVYPRAKGNYGWVHMSDRSPFAVKMKHELDEANRLAEEARRHLDDYNNVTVRYDLYTVCSDGETVDSETSALDQWPACCDADMAEFYREHEAESDEWFTAHGMDDPDYLAEFRAGHHQGEVVK